MVDALVIPLAILVEHEHLLRHVVSIDHVQINAVVLFEEASPRGAPVVIRSDGNDLLDRNILFKDTA